jgi:hypothetical protein
MDHRLPAACLIALFCSPALASEPLFYADTCVEQESGDVAGYVVIIQDGAAQPSISLSWSEGRLMEPAAATVTDYDPASGRLAFHVHLEYGDFHFIGKIKTDHLEGTISSPFEDGSRPLQLKALPRQNAFEPTAECQ